MWPEDPLPLPSSLFRELPVGESYAPRPMRPAAIAWLKSQARTERVNDLLADARRLKCRCQSKRTCVGCQARALRQRDTRARQLKRIRQRAA